MAVVQFDRPVVPGRLDQLAQLRVGNGGNLQTPELADPLEHRPGVPPPGSGAPHRQERFQAGEGVVAFRVDINNMADVRHPSVGDEAVGQENDSLSGNVFGDVGWAAIPAAEREGVSDPAPASGEYATRLYQSYIDHQPPGGHQAAERKQPSEDELADAKFRRFVEAMQVWDRAMAQGIADRLRGENPPILVAIMGSGHLRDGNGVPRQLRDLGVARIATALPWDTSDGCAELTPGIADVVVGSEGRPQPPRSDRPRLGITIDSTTSGVRVRTLVPGSIAERAGLRADDVIVRIAGEPAAEPSDVVEAVQRQAPGTWLPITVKRGDETLDIVAQFPPRK